MGQKQTSEASSALAVGVNVGDSSGFVAVCKGDHPDVLANHLGERFTPSYVAFADGEEVVGETAKSGRVRNGPKTITRFVSLLGSQWSDVTSQAQWRGLCPVVEQDGKPVFSVTFDSGAVKTITPVQATSKLLLALKATVQQLGQPVNNVVIAVPAEFSPAALDALKAAADPTGLRITRFIKQPCAVALAYGLGQTDRTETLNALVLDVGGTKTRATVVAVQNGLYRVVAHSVEDCGGADLDAALVEMLAQEFRRQSKMDISGERRSLAKLLAAAEEARKTLSTVPSTQVSVDSLHEGVDLRYSLARSRFEGVSGAVFKRIMDTVQRTLTAAERTPAQIDKVLFAGGVAKTPRLKVLVNELFGREVVQDSITPDEAAANGASVQAALIGDDASTAEEVRALQDVPALAADIAVADATGSLQTIFSRGTPLPARTTIKLLTDKDQQTSITLRLRELGIGGEEPTNLGDVTLQPITAAPAGEADITASFHIEKNGVMKIVVKDVKSDLSVTASL